MAQCYSLCAAFAVPKLLAQPPRAVLSLIRSSHREQRISTSLHPIRHYSSDNKGDGGYHNDIATSSPPTIRHVSHTQSSAWFGRDLPTSSADPRAHIAPPPPFPLGPRGQLRELPPRHSSINHYNQPSPYAKGQRTYPVNASPPDDREKLRELGLYGPGTNYWSSLLNFPDYGEGEVQPKPRTDDAYTPPPLSVRLKPVSGKVFHISGGLPATAAFSSLQKLCSVENISSMWRRQKYHERGGLKRKRLKSERWRKRFAAGFSATVTRVQYLTKQGW